MIEQRGPAAFEHSLAKAGAVAGGGRFGEGGLGVCHRRRC